MLSETNPAASQSCRMLSLVVLGSVLMMGIGNGIFLWNELRQKNTDVTFARKLVAEYQTNNEPRIKEFIASLQAYARTNPDINPLLAKYSLVPTSTPLPAAPAAAPKK